MIKVYGIKNCDTVRKARKWLNENQVQVEFCDIKAEGVTEKKLKVWCKMVGWETLLNRRGTTWRKLPESEKEALSETKAIRIMSAHPTCIKRPLLELDSHLIVGFCENEYKILKNP